MARSVVDLPEPVGPVTRTSPLCKAHRLRIACDSPSFSAVRIWLGMTRNTAPRPFRSMKMFARNRARPAISYAKSVSCRSSNSVLFLSGVMGSSSATIDSGVNAAAVLSSGWIEPSLRTSGGMPQVRCRSDAPEVHIAMNSESIGLMAPARPPVLTTGRRGGGSRCRSRRPPRGTGTLRASGCSR